MRSRRPVHRRSRLRWTAGGAVAAALVATFLGPAPVAAHDGDQTSLTSELDQGEKNAISRSGEAVTAETMDPTTPAQAEAARRVVAEQRQEPTPALGHTSLRDPRTDVPHTRYAMAGGCYALRAPSGLWVRRDGHTLVADAARRDAAEPLHFQATRLGGYLLYGTGKDFLARTSSDPTGLAAKDQAAFVAEPGPDGDWTVQMPVDGKATFGFRDGRDLVVGQGSRLVVGDQPSPFALRTTEGCRHFPEAAVDVKGLPFTGRTSFQQVTGYVDAHTHGMAFEFLGGDAHCGKPWSPYGVTVALQDCPDHMAAHGCATPLETALSGRPCHDPVGWPTFKDWPAPDSLTHEGTYWRWMERAWRGGLRVFTNLLVENNQLCMLYPIKHNSCDDMDSVRLQAKDMYRFQDYIDAQYGGPGKGWYRIVTNPFQARRVANAGRLAVVMGIETSIPFGCTIKLDQPQCDSRQIDRQLASVRKMGVRQMELVNKFDNALSGVAGDEAETGVLVNSANFLETGSFWAMRHCEYPDPEVHDKEQYAAPTIDPEQQDALFGAVYQAFGTEQPVPVYNRAPHCNARGLTDLGEHLVRRLAAHHMLFDPDHMSVKARKASLDLVERMDYPGILSSHSWSTPDAYPRILRAGGFIAPYAGDSKGFVEKWKRTQTWADPRYFFGLGYGADINGLGAQGDPRGADVPNPVTYPFTGLGGVRVLKQHAGKRVYDINVDGVAQYGLYPDWVQDLKMQAGPAIVKDMARGAEAYLQTWERAVGVDPDGCRDASVRKPARVFENLQRGMTTKRVLLRAGQPHERLGRTYSYCATREGARTTLDVVFDASGHLDAVRF